MHKIFLECAAQICSPCERGIEGKILKAKSIQIIEVHVCHNKKGKSYSERNEEAHSWI